MHALLSFKNLEEEDSDNCCLPDELRAILNEHHSNLMTYVAIPEEGGEEEGETKVGFNLLYFALQNLYCVFFSLDRKEKAKVRRGIPSSRD